MSTRATYRFVVNGRTPDFHSALTLYIHSDGYPIGAAEYFAKAVDSMLSDDSRGGLLENFIRANERAELTGGHEAHGDTEWRYTVAQDDVLTIVVHVRAHGWTTDAPTKWRVFFAGSLMEFLNDERTNAEREKAEWASALLASNGYKVHAGCLVSVAWLTAQARRCIDEARRQLANGWTGNASGAAGAAARYVGSGAEVSLAEIVAVLREACATSPHMVAYYLNKAGLPVELEGVA